MKARVIQPKCMESQNPRLFTVSAPGISPGSRRSHGSVDTQVISLTFSSDGGIHMTRKAGSLLHLSKITYEGKDTTTYAGSSLQSSIIAAK